MRENHRLLTLNRLENGKVVSIFLNVKLLAGGTKIELYSKEMIKVTGDNVDETGNFNPTISYHNLDLMDEEELRMFDVARMGMLKLVESNKTMEDGTPMFDMFKHFCYVHSGRGILVPLETDLDVYIRDINLEEFDSENTRAFSRMGVANMSTVVFIKKREIHKLKEMEERTDPNKSDRTAIVYTKPVGETIRSIVLSVKIKDGKYVTIDEDLTHLMVSALSDTENLVTCNHFKLHDIDNLPSSVNFTKNMVDTALYEANKILLTKPDVAETDMLFISSIDIFSEGKVGVTGFIKGLSKYVDIFDYRVAKIADSDFQGSVLDIQNSAKTSYIIHMNQQIEAARELMSKESMFTLPEKAKDKPLC